MESWNNTKTCSQHSYWERRVKVMQIVTYLIIHNSIEVKILIQIPSMIKNLQLPNQLQPRVIYLTDYQEVHHRM